MTKRLFCLCLTTLLSLSLSADEMTFADGTLNVRKVARNAVRIQYTEDGATQTDLPVNANGTALALRAGDNVIDHCGTGVINRGYMETASQTQISDNTQGISNSGTLILSRVSLMRNTGGEAGGLVNAESGQVAMTDVAIRGNSGSVAGGILMQRFSLIK